MGKQETVGLHVLYVAEAVKFDVADKMAKIGSGRRCWLAFPRGSAALSFYFLLASHLA